MEIVWEDPPPALVRTQGRSGKYTAFAEALRANPEKWALLAAGEGEDRTEKGSKGTAQNIRRGTMKDFKPKGAFEAVAEGGKIWARFVGEPDDAAEQPELDPDETDEERLVREQETAERIQAEADFAPKVRQWAAVKGIPVSERGRLSAKLVRDYCKDTGTPLPRNIPALVE